MYIKERGIKMKKEKTKSNWVVTVLLFAMVFGIMVPAITLAAEDPDKFPSRPISLIITWPPGSTTDMTGRKLAELTSKILNISVVPENRAGGTGVIGTNDVAKANPDGYTLTNTTSDAILVAPNYQKVPYNPNEDFSPILLHTEVQTPFCVLPDARWKSFKEFIEEARKNPGKLKYASTGAKGGAQVVIQQVADIEKVKLNHVPTTGGSETVALFLGGHVDAAMGVIMGANIGAKKARGLAIATGDKRMDVAPDVPTLLELGYKVEFPMQWFGVFGPKGIDPRILKKLQDAFKKAWDDPSFHQLLKNVALTPHYMGPEELRQLIRTDFEVMGKIAKKY